MAERWLNERGRRLHGDTGEAAVYTRIFTGSIPRAPEVF
jgi:hypothetical protein